MIRRPRARRALRASAKASAAASARARAAAELGRGAEKFALHVKGQELPMHDPRGKKGLSFAHALSPTGADHMEAPHDPLDAGFHPQGHPMGPLGLIEPLAPLDLDARKVRAFLRDAEGLVELPLRRHV